MPAPSQPANAHPPWIDERAARAQIAEVAREIYGRKLSGATDGNLSIRIGADRVATSPSGVHKGRLTPDHIVVVDLSGRVVGRPGKRADGQLLKPSSEIALHLAAYRARSDVAAVIHAHPPHAIAYTLAGGQLSETLVSEVVFACGQIATAPYTTPTTQQVPAMLGDYLRCYDVVMMPRHGSVTVGPDLDTALGRLDALEHTAGIYCMARLLGGATPIAAPEVDRLFALAHPNPPPYRTAASGCPAPEPAPEGEAALVAAVLRALGARP
ncbi:MAG: class II aldolase/adducin family protein [Deltaproteobacteria bacterium]|nr:class II aldolase/adducin family protein [Deltaproteobacteria bacterium]